MAEEKKESRFEYAQVEGAVKQLMKPNVAQILEKMEVDVSEFLPMFYEQSEPLENETVDQYALRCIDAALALKTQERYKTGKLDKTDVPRLSATIENPEKNESKGKSEEHESKSSEGASVYEQAADLEKKVIFAVLGMPFKMMQAIAEKNNTITTVNKEGNVELTEMSETETASLSQYLAKVHATFEKALELDGIDASSLSRIKLEDPLPAKVSEGIGKTSHNIHEYAAEMRALLSNEANRDLARKFEELGISIDDFINSSFATIDLSDGKTMKDAAIEALQKMGTEIIMDDATKAQELIQRPDKYRKDPDRKMSRQQEEKPNNELIASINETLKFPFKAFKTLITGKTEEEQKEDAKKISNKFGQLELGTKIEKETKIRIANFYGRLELLKDNPDYELVGYSKYKNQVPEQPKGQDGPTPEPEGPVEPVDPTPVSEPAPPKIDTPEAPETKKPEKPGKAPEVSEEPVPPKVEGNKTNDVQELDQPENGMSYDEVMGQANAAINKGRKNAPTFREPVGRRKITPNFIVQAPGANKDILAELIAEFDELDLDDPVASMIWVSDVAKITDGPAGLTISAEDRARIVEKLEANKYISDTTAKMPNFSDLSPKGKKAFVLTMTSRMLGEKGTGKLTMDLAGNAEMVIARENPEQAFEGMIYGQESYDKKEPRVDRSKMSQNDLAYQQKIDKLMQDFDGLDFSDRDSVIAWMQEYGEIAALMEQAPDIDKAAMEKKLKENGIDTRIGADELYSPNSQDRDEASTWYVTVGASQILQNGKIAVGLVDRMGAFLPEKQQEAIQARGLSPMEKEKLDAVRGIVHKTMEANRGDKEGREVIASINHDMHPELLAALEEEERRKETEAQEFGHTHELPTEH